MRKPSARGVLRIVVLTVCLPWREPSCRMACGRGRCACRPPSHRLLDLDQAGDDGLPTRLHEAQAGGDLRAHRARLEVAFGGQRLHLAHRHRVDGALVGRAVVDIHLGDVGEDQQDVGADLLGEQGGGEILVDDRRDAVETAAAVARHGDAAAARADHERPALDQGRDRRAGDDLAGLRRRHDPPPAAAGVLAHGDALLEHHLRGGASS